MIDNEWGEPPESAVRVDVAYAENGMATVRLTGELDLSCESAVDETMAELLAAGVPGIVIDLAGVSLCDSSGIRILIKSCRTGGTLGVPVRVDSIQPLVATVLQLTGVWELLTQQPLPIGP